jgi:protein TonB
VVSLFEEKQDNKPEFRRLSHKQQRQENVSVEQETALSDVRSGSELNVPVEYSGVRRKSEKSGTTSDEDSYSLIRAAISRSKIYPLLARKRKIEGAVITGFRIDEKGRPQELKIEKSSGHEILDSAALKIVTKAAPFPRVNGEIIVPITFKLTEHSSSN